MARQMIVKHRNKSGTIQVNPYIFPLLFQLYRYSKWKIFPAIWTMLMSCVTSAFIRKHSFRHQRLTACCRSSPVYNARCLFLMFGRFNRCTYNNSCEKAKKSNDERMMPSRFSSSSSNVSSSCRGRGSSTNSS